MGINFAHPTFPVMRTFPAIAAALGLWSSIIVASYLPLTFMPLVVGLIILSLVIVLRLDQRLRWFGLFVAFVAFGLLRSPDAKWNRLSSFKAIRNPLPIVAIIETDFLGRIESGAIARVIEVRFGPKWLESHKVLVRGLDTDHLAKCKRLEVKGRVFCPAPKLNPFGVDLRSNLRRRGISAILVAQASEACSYRKVPDLLTLLRAKVESEIDRSLEPDMAGIIKALLVGIRDDLDPEVSNLLGEAGIYHIIAISGLHVGIVAILLKVVMGTLRIGRRVSGLILIWVVFGYVVFTGWQSSARRAFALVWLLVLVSLAESKIDIRNGVALVVVLLLVLEPWLAWDLGFQLSVLAVLGVAAFAWRSPVSPVSSSPSILVRDYIINPILFSIGAQTFALPLIAYHFGRLPILNPLLNMAAMPVATLAVAGGLEAIAVLAFSRKAFEILLAGTCLPLKLLISTLGILQKHLNLSIAIVRPAPCQILACCCLIFILLLLCHKLRALAKIGLALVIWLVLVFQPGDHDRLRMTFLAVGDGDACLIETPQGSKILYDCGPASSDLVRASPLERLLTWQRIAKLDCVIISHPHGDHYGGLADIVERVEIGKVIVGSLVGEASYMDLLRKIQSKQVPIATVDTGDTLSFDDVKIKIIRPYIESSPKLLKRSDPNELSLVTRITYRGFSALLTGDATCTCQNLIASEPEPISSQILKVPHHGARDALDSVFLHKVSPLCAVISAGWRSPHHPARDTMDQLRRSNIETLITGVDGAVMVETDGTATTVSTIATRKKLRF